MHRIAPDVVTGVLDRRDLGEQTHGPFGGNIRWRPNGHQARDRRDVHNRAPARPAHGRNGVLRAQKYPLRIHRHDAVPVGFRRVLDPFAEHNARIIHQDIQFAIVVDRRAHGLDPIGLVGHIQMHIGRLTALGADRLLYLLPHCIQDVAHHYAGAFLREEPRFGRPLPPGPATNQGDFALQSAHGSLLSATHGITRTIPLPMLCQGSTSADAVNPAHVWSNTARAGAARGGHPAVAAGPPGAPWPWQSVPQADRMSLAYSPPSLCDGGGNPSEPWRHNWCRTVVIFPSQGGRGNPGPVFSSSSSGHGPARSVEKVNPIGGSIRQQGGTRPADSLDHPDTHALR